jgi:CelD/BcsL family acetyltransferase involved in cellulose biosynthesis
LWVTGEYFDGFRAASLAARGRLDRESQPDPFQRIDWFTSVWEHERPGERPLIVRARSSAGEAWLFLARTRPNRLVSAGGALSPRFAPVFAGEVDDGMRRTLLRAMARRLKSQGIARLSLGPLLGPDAGLLRQSFERAGWTVTARGAGANFRLTVAGRNFEDFWETCSARLHEQVAAGSRHLTIEIADLLTPQLSEEMELVGGNNPFLRSLAEDATLDRTLRLAVARIGDAPVAVQLWTFEDGVGTAIWRAEDGTARSYFPSAELTASMLRYLINVDHADTVDLGNGEDDELAEWADERRPLYRLDLFNPRAPSAWGPALAASASALVRRPALD